MMDNFNIQGTTDTIINQDIFDFDIFKDYAALAEGRGSETSSENATLAQVLFSNKNEPLNIDNHSYYRKKLVEVLSILITNPNTQVTVKQSPLCSYMFHFTGTGNFFMLTVPLVMARILLYYFNLWGITCTVEKENKELFYPLKRAFREIVFLGKTSIDFPQKKELLKAIKPYNKVKLQPWFPQHKSTEESLPEEPDEASIRFRDAKWFNAAQKPVTLVGCGGLGSNINVSLCRVLGNSSLFLYDMDTVEYKNLAGQNFGITEVGLNKATAVAQQAQNFNPLLYTSVNGRFNINSYISPVIIGGVDNMATRNLIFTLWTGKVEASSAKDTFLLIDARLSAEKWQVFCIAGTNEAAQKEYSEKWLFSDEEADSEVCTYKQTAYAAQMCAAFVTNLYINFCYNTTLEPDSPLKRYLPFMTEYDASQMILRTQEI